jgi:7-cyano-7-deazaguanine synthase
MKDIVCIYSGGMDSFTLVAQTLEEDRLHSCVSFDYGQRHATRACNDWGVRHTIVDLRAMSFVLKASALLGGIALPEGHSTDPAQKSTVVPNRNMIMLSIAVAHAAAHDCTEVRFGAHAGDREIYPDCRNEFVEALSLASRLGAGVAISAPYLDIDKVGILTIGFALNLDYTLAWTCYRGEGIACGRCGSCQERLSAFAAIGKQDPLAYVTRELIAKVTS